jgi:hypothetical protein
LTRHRRIIPDSLSFSVGVASAVHTRLGSAAADSIPGCRLVPICQRCVAVAFPRPSSVT